MYLLFAWAGMPLSKTTQDNNSNPFHTFNSWRLFIVTDTFINPQLYCSISFPLDNVSQFPGILVKLELQLSFLIDDELRGRKENTVTVVLVLTIQVDLTGGQIETLCLGTPIGFSEGNLSVSNPTDGPAGRRDNLPYVAKIVPKVAGDRYPAHAFHLLEGIHQPVVLPLLECLRQDVSVLRTRELINNDLDSEVSSELCACAKGCGVDGFALPLSKAGEDSDHKQTNQERDSIR